MILAGTGHRPEKFGGYGKNPIAAEVVRRTGAELDRLRPDKVLSGMALGFDQWLAWLCVKRSIPFVACLPFEGQDRRWFGDLRRNYETLLSKAAEVVVVTKLTVKHAPKWAVIDALDKRNRWMVDHSDKLLAAWNGEDSGTGNCVRYANAVGREVVPVDLSGLRITA